MFSLSRWVSVVIILGLGAASVPHVWAADVPTFTVVAVSAFLRDEPSVQAPATYSVFQGQVFGILGRTTDNAWMQLDYPRAKKGTWILATLGKVTGDLTTIPVIKANSTSPAVTSAPVAPPTVEPTPTPASTAPSEICVLLYHDTNGNGMLDLNEGAITGGQLTILDTSTGTVVQTYTTRAGESDGHCFKGLSAGAYTVAAAAPAGYNATMATSRLLQAEAGEHYQLTFGAQPGSAGSSAGGRFTLSLAVWGALGVLCLLLAAGAARFLISRRT